DAHALHDAVGKHRQRFTRHRREQHHDTDVFVAGRRGNFRLNHAVTLLIPADDVRVHAHGHERWIVQTRFHRLESVYSRLARGWENEIRTRPVDRLALLP